MAIACRIKAPTLIICTSSASVSQQRTELLQHTTIAPHHVVRITSCFNERGGHQVCLSTYSFLSYGGPRTEESERKLLRILSRDYGLVIFDEVHVVPARTFRSIIQMCVRTSIKVGMSATLLREDNKIKDLNELIGPQRFCADWQQLAQLGHLACVRCIQIKCPLTSRFREAYDQQWHPLHYILNPNKLAVAEYLMHHHEQQGRKVIIFSDCIRALRTIAHRLQRPFIDGDVGDDEFTLILHGFRASPHINTICFSKVGDTSLDLPEASIVIQLSSHFGSRRQETQRLGRILRPKKGLHKQALFYSLVSSGTREAEYAKKRQSFNCAMGFQYEESSMAEVLPPSFTPTLFHTEDEQRALLDTFPRKRRAPSNDKLYNKKQMV